MVLTWLTPFATIGSDRTDTTPAVFFDVPTLVGRSNFSQPGGTKFWFPSISISTGIKGHVAQHITLANDGGWGPAGPEGPCGSTSHPQAYCQQIMLTTDSGRSYATVRKVTRGTSGNFNGYGDLGTLVPAKEGAAVPGRFHTIVGCNDCGTAFTHPTFLQTWEDDGDGNLSMQANVSVRFVDPPQEFNGSSPACASSGCGLSTFSQSIVRVLGGRLLAAAYGHAAGQQLYSTVFFASDDDGRSWSYRSRIDATAAMKGAIKGPAETALVTLADGRVLAVFRITSDVSLWKACSGDHGKSWSEPVALSGTMGGEAAVVYSVWPQLLRLSNGALVLASGRPGIGFWVSSDAGGEAWVGHDVQAAHSRLVPTDPYDDPSETTSYTGIAEVEPGVVLLSYDKVGARRVGDVQKVYAVRINVSVPMIPHSRIT